jgi:hypothetical protein
MANGYATLLKGMTIPAVLPTHPEQQVGAAICVRFMQIAMLGQISSTPCGGHLVPGLCPAMMPSTTAKSRCCCQCMRTGSLPGSRPDEASIMWWL